jgi:hypothetical protein
MPFITDHLPEFAFGNVAEEPRGGTYAYEAIGNEESDNKITFACGEQENSAARTTASPPFPSREVKPQAANTPAKSEAKSSAAG